MAYAPTGTITIAFGAKWTIQPGVVIKFGRLFVDQIGTVVYINGALAADGKPDSLIVFTSTADDAFGGDTRSDGALTSPAPGNWSGIQFNPVSNDAGTVINHCRFRYAGYSGFGTLRFTSAGPTVSNSVITLGSLYGMVVEGNSTPTFTNVDVDSCTHVPVQMSLVSEPVFNNVMFLGNTYTALGVINESIAQDALWKIRPVSGRNNMPYLLQGQLTTGLGATVTLQPGLIVKGLGGSVLIQRAFLAEGRTPPESLIVFTSYRDDFYGGDTNNDGATTLPAAGDWAYVTVDGTAIDPQVRFKNCVFRYGGSGTTFGALRCVNSSPSVDSCIVAYNSVGISVEGASNPTVNGSSLYGNVYWAINNTGNSFCVNAENNWWGAASGPNDASATADLCALGTNAGAGDKVSNNVDYVSWATSGIQNPLLGDVSLNGQVLAYDASLVLQSVALLITLNPLQELVGDVSGAAGVTAFDASLILQYVAGLIPAFPAASNGAQPAPPDVLAAREVVARAQGSFQVWLGQAVPDGGSFRVPVHVAGTAPVHALEISLQNGSAGTLAEVLAAGGALEAHAAGPGAARVALASAEVLGESALELRFTPPAGEAFAMPELVWARVNESELNPTPVPAPVAPALSFLARPAPNPTRSPVRFALGVAAADAGAPARVTVYDLAGRVVRVLHDGALPAGVHDLAWDLTRADGGVTPPGVYLVRARTRSFEATQRLVVVR
jgi:parallel beta-helix repeat protein